MNLNKFSRIGAVAALSLAATQAFAVGVDISAVTAAGADVATVGAAVFAVVVGIMVFKWIRRAL